MLVGLVRGLALANMKLGITYDVDDDVAFKFGKLGGSKIRSGR